PKNKEIEKEKKSEEKVYKVASINDNKDNVEKYLDKDINYDAKENINEGSIEEDDIEENKDKLTKFKEVIKNIKYKINYIKEKINFIISYPNKNQILNMIFLLLKSLIKAIKFKKIKINVDYGLDEPFKTGNVCAIISAIIPFLPKKYIKDIKIMPDFENELFLADLEIKCKSSLFKLLFPIIIFISKKPIREIIFSKGE
ncbi:DUF2953 domain-containing protein, partial [uncultured Tyzzerella sp.]|uniref:DUF2953 domain-containing protein n=1 Tax=uncultured Tyzzerella sp. TaxID=2321398 RepID=UPI0029433B60